MSTAAAAGMQAALLIREKQRLRRKKFRKGRADLPSHVATRDIGPFPQYPPGFMCSQGRAAWQERERGRRCSLSEEARQHRLKQTEAHHRWMKRNRIHDCTYGPGSVSSSEFGLGAYHQSAAANALLYVGLGATAIGSVIFFVGTGEKGFKTLELRLIGPTLIACGLVCCLIRVLLCAIPSSKCCQRKKQATRLKKDVCPHSSSRYPLTSNFREPRDTDFVKMERTSLLNKSKKKVSIVPPNHSLPSTSTTDAKDFHETTKIPPYDDTTPMSSTRLPAPILVAPVMSIPEIQLPTASSGSSIQRADSIIELQPMDLYDARSISSSDESAGAPDDDTKGAGAGASLDCGDAADKSETCLSVVIERNDNSDGSDIQVAVTTDQTNQLQGQNGDKHSGIVLSPLQLQGQ
ncbi:unnamed protein product [Acanthoscelides obtectus]|uniref:Uncharacterized protein n=1 Tax=Acanthoscelides obtectus TaxID=200917 RepID=A0A9P0JHK2_ACAOB|nr:unnamed protein product [Acanthoscelides obtectus]CAK1661439.1 hypothetical protein AOBTE_LOCUS22622 [Acanthoscelides obtectus]